MKVDKPCAANEPSSQTSFLLLLPTSRLWGSIVAHKSGAGHNSCVGGGLAQLCSAFVPSLVTSGMSSPRVDRTHSFVMKPFQGLCRAEPTCCLQPLPPLPLASLCFLLKPVAPQCKVMLWLGGGARSPALQLLLPLQNAGRLTLLFVVLTPPRSPSDARPAPVSRLQVQQCQISPAPLPFSDQAVGPDRSHP